KGAPYVAQTTQTYRAAIDAAAAGREFELSDAELRDLTQVYSRGFVPGFLEGVNHQRLVGGRFPKSRGVRLGVVAASTKRGMTVTVDADVAVKPGDGVVFDLGRPEEQEPGGRVFEVLPRREAVELRFADGALDLAAIPVGAIVWKTDDPALRKRL